LNSSSNIGNIWSNGATSQSITVSTSGSYSVTVSNGFCSTSSNPIVVTVYSNPSNPIVTPLGNTTFCQGDSVLLTSSYPSGNLWSNGLISSSVFVTQTGLYSLQYTDNNGCSSNSIGIPVTVLTLPTASVLPNGPTTICEGETVILTSYPASTYFWSIGASSQSVTIDQSGVYSVVVSGSNGCINSSPPIEVIVNSNSQSVLNEIGIDNYTLNGQTYTQSGIYFQVLPNSFGCDSTITLNLTLGFTGIESNLLNKTNPYPNPTNNLLIVEGTFEINTIYKIIDAVGRIVLSGTFESGINQIDVLNFSRGTYNLFIQGSVAPIRFIKN
jgi:hypothetical protein